VAETFFGLARFVIATLSDGMFGGGKFYSGTFGFFLLFSPSFSRICSQEKIPDLGSGSF
jgi:hypothetical protein